MTPLEKAGNLIDKYLNYLPFTSSDMGEGPGNKYAKECSLICVYEILIGLSQMPQDDLKIKFESMWWESVIEEIKKM